MRSLPLTKRGYNTCYAIKSKGVQQARSKRQVPSKKSQQLPDFSFLGGDTLSTNFCLESVVPQNTIRDTRSHIDDILVHGPIKKVQDQRPHQVLQQIQRKGLTLNSNFINVVSDYWVTLLMKMASHQIRERCQPHRITKVYGHGQSPK